MGWRHRLALIEAADLSWFTGDRIGPDRLALWITLRLSGVQGDTAALARVGWAVRRMTGGQDRRWIWPLLWIGGNPRTWRKRRSPWRIVRAVGWT